MSAVDRSDQMLATHNVQWKCIRWWKTLFFHLIDMAVVNSFILFREQQRKFRDNAALRQPARNSLASYREELVRNICNLPDRACPPTNESISDRNVGAFHLNHCPIFLDVRKQCVEGRGHVFVFSSCSAPQCQGLYMHVTRERNCYQVFHSLQFQNKYGK